MQYTLFWKRTEQNFDSIFQKDIYPVLVLFEQSNCVDWIKFCFIWSLTKISFFWYPIHVERQKKKQEQYKHRHNSIPILLWWHKIVLKYDLCWHNVSCLNMWFINEIKTINFCTSLLQTYLIKHTPLTSLASESTYSLSIHITVLNYNQYLFLVNK